MRVVVVHPLRVDAVEPDHVGRDALAEVGLECVDPLVEQPLQLGREPLRRSRIGEVDQRHSGLPLVPLPDAAVGPGDQVALRPALLEQRRPLRDVRVDPDADPQPLGLEPGQHRLRLGEGDRVPLEVAPAEFAHPEAVEMKDAERDLALGHAVDEAADGLLVVIGGERRGQPQPERPLAAPGAAGRSARCTWPGSPWASGPWMTKYSRCLTGHRELAAGHRLGGDLEGDPLGVVDEDPVARVGPEERHVLVGLLAAGSAVGVPDVDRLAVLDQRVRTARPGRRPIRRRPATAAGRRTRRPGRWPGRSTAAPRSSASGRRGRNRCGRGHGAPSPSTHPRCIDATGASVSIDTGGGRLPATRSRPMVRTSAVVDDVDPQDVRPAAS